MGGVLQRPVCAKKGHLKVGKSQINFLSSSEINLFNNDVSRIPYKSVKQFEPRSIGPALSPNCL